MPRLNVQNLLAAGLAGAMAHAHIGPACAEPITFETSCAASERLRIAAVGDLLFHQTLQKQALAAKSDYRRFWAPVQAILSRADIVYGNFEGPAADGVAAGGGAVRDPGRTLDGRVYGTTPGALVFNYHPSALADLKASGFTIISTANNHAADRGSLGIDRTIDNVRRSGLAYTGTRRRDEGSAPWSTVTRAKGFAVAWLACTYSTNGMPDRYGQTLNCYSQRDTIMAELQRLAADPAIDAVIFTPHWGQEYAHQPQASDRRYARDAIEAGADAVLGAHPHVLQPWERYRSATGRDGLIVYSLGNFISNQQKPAQRSGIIALLEFTKAEGMPRAQLAAAGYVPTWVDFTALGHRVTEMRGDPAAKATPLAAVLQILPKANRVSSATLADLPRNCSSQLVASASVAVDLAMAGVDDTPPDALRVADAATVQEPLQSAPKDDAPEFAHEPGREPKHAAKSTAIPARAMMRSAPTIAGAHRSPSAPPAPVPDEPRRLALHAPPRHLATRTRLAVPPIA